LDTHQGRRTITESTADLSGAKAAGANNGSLTLWIDSNQKAGITGMDNDTRRIDRVLLSTVSGIDTGTRGIAYFDVFESRCQSYIGSQLAF